MKKNILSIAIVAATACVVVACGNKSVNNTGSADSTEVAGVPEKTEIEQNLPEVKTGFDKKTFAVSVPEGWNTTPNPDTESSDIMVFKGDMEKIMTSPALIINVDEPEDGKSFDDAIKTVDEDTNTKAIDDVTIGGRTFKGFQMTEGEVTGTILCAEENGKMISVTIVNTQVDDPEVRAIIRSLKVK